MLVAILGHMSFVHISGVLLKALFVGWNFGFEKISSQVGADFVVKIDLQQLVAFVICWFIHLPLCFVGLGAMKRVMTLQIYATIIAFAILITYCFSVLNSGPLMSWNAYNRPSPYPDSSSFFLTFVGSVLSMSGVYFCFASNYSDLVKAVISYKETAIATLLSLPLFSTLAALVGGLIYSFFTAEYGFIGSTFQFGGSALGSIFDLYMI